MKYHIIGSKQIKPCNCTNCRAKYGSYETLEAAELALEDLVRPPTTNVASETIEVEPTPAPTGDFEDIYIEMPEEALIVADEETPDDSPDSVPAKRTYFDDDREFLKSEDEILELSPDSGLLEQMENVVSWRIDNFYDEDGKRRSRLGLRSDPPIFRIESSDGATAEFVLTKNLTITLAETFENVKRGYFGVDPKKNSLTQGEAQSKFAEMQNWATAHPVKAVGLVILLVLFVVTAFTL